MKVYMATHIEQEQTLYDYVEPIHVGAYFSQGDFGILKDDTGDNISNKNKVFCEITALYWMWKNTDIDRLGLCHYRRFFNIDELSINSSLDNGKVIVPNIAYLGRSLEKQYLHNQESEPWHSMMDVLRDKYPKFYETSKTVFAQNEMYPFNMFISSREFFNKYSRWLFSILFEVEKSVDISGYDEFQTRYAGFLAERLFTLYMKHTGQKVYEVKLIDYNYNDVSQSLFRKLRNRLYFFITNRRRV